MVTGRAKPGQGEATLKGIAREVAQDLGHELGNFRPSGRRSHDPVVLRGRIVPPPAPRIFEARCRACLAAAIVDQDAWKRDRKGFGGSATRERCTAPHVADRQPTGAAA